jgi:uncharacterized protein (TIGR00251 family)
VIKLTAREDGVAFAVRVQPRASRSEVAGELDGALKVRLAAPPVEGEANDELIRLLARLFGLPRSQVTLAAGHTSKNKVVRVYGLSLEACERALKDVLGQL